MVRAEFLAAGSQFLIAGLFSNRYGHCAVARITDVSEWHSHRFFSCHRPWAFITQVVKKEELQAANSLLGAARSSAVMTGAALAGLLVALFGAGIAIAIDATSFVISAMLILSVRAKPQERGKAESLLVDLKLGWREFTSHQWLWTIVLQFSLIVAAVEAVFGLLGPAISKDLLGGPVDWGFIAAASGLGTVVGGLIALRISVKRPMFFASCLCFFFAGVSLTLAIPAPVWVIAFAAFIGGVAGQIFAVIWYTTLQMQIPGNMLSRVSAYDHLGSVCTGAPWLGCWGGVV